uniref:LysM domain-containing protein n=1 Tax=Hanusia phi TaxID=3032 RepID=A0A7S0I3D4_9CRYP
MIGGQGSFADVYGNPLALSGSMNPAMLSNMQKPKGQDSSKNVSVLMQPCAEEINRVIAMNLPDEAKAAMEKIAGNGIPVYSLEGDAKRGSEIREGDKVMYGKLSYKGNGCNCYILCENESQALEKVGLMRFMKLANNTCTRPKSVIFICATKQSIADFEKQYAVQTKVVEKKEDVHSAESGKNVPPDAEPSEAGSANLVEKKQVVLSANWPEDGVYICKEDDKCCDIAKLFGVDLDLLVEKNKKTYKALTKTVRLKEGTMLQLPLPGEVKKVAADATESKKPVKKSKANEGNKSKSKNNQSDLAEEVEEAPEVILSRWSANDTPEQCGHRQVSLTDRIPFNIVKDTDVAMWDSYREETLAAASFETLVSKLVFMQSQLLSPAFNLFWLENKSADWVSKCKQVKDATGFNECLQDLFLQGIDWESVNRHWDIDEEQEEDFGNYAPAALVETLSSADCGMRIFCELNGERQHGKLYIGRHPKDGSPIWLVQVEKAPKGRTSTAFKLNGGEHLKATSFVQTCLNTKISQPLKKIFIDETAQTLHDWLVQRGHIDKPQLASSGAIALLADIMPDVSSKQGEAANRIHQILERVPLAAVKSKKEEVWKEFFERVGQAQDPKPLANSLKWMSEQLITKVLEAQWLQNSREDWEVRCERCETWKELNLLLLEFEDDGINWRAVEGRISMEKSKQASEGKEGKGQETRKASHKKKRELKDAILPYPFAVGAQQSLPDGWKVTVHTASLWRLEDCVVTLCTPDGLFLHSIEEVLKYYSITGRLAEFTESLRRTFVHALQEARGLHTKRFQRLAKYLALDVSASPDPAPGVLAGTTRGARLLARRDKKEETHALTIGSSRLKRVTKKAQSTNEGDQGDEKSIEEKFEIEKLADDGETRTEEQEQMEQEQMEQEGDDPENEDVDFNDEGDSQQGIESLE